MWVTFFCFCFCFFNFTKNGSVFFPTQGTRNWIYGSCLSNKQTQTNKKPTTEPCLQLSFYSLFLKYSNFIYLFVCVGGGARNTPMPEHSTVSWDQRTVYKNWFSPSTRGSQGLQTQGITLVALLYPLSHMNDPFTLYIWHRILQSFPGGPWT